jgi:hypothetical protein
MLIPLFYEKVAFPDADAPLRGPRHAIHGYGDAARWRRRCTPISSAGTPHMMKPMP